MQKEINKLINHLVKDAPNGFPKFYEIPDKEERFSKFVLEASSNIINKILFIRIIEDKGFVKPKLTKQFVKEWKETWSTDRLQNIMKLFRDACEQAEDLYNGGLFRLNPYDGLPYDNDIIEKIMGILGDFQFEEIDADVIGRIYEIYLGTVLSVEEEIRGKKRTKLSADYTERKKLGQYYTPKFVVDFIVKNTLGKLLEGETPEEVSKIKILDPACGSGSFLIRAFDYLKDYKAELKEIAELREKIKEYYGKELDRKKQDVLEKMESKLRELRNKVNIPLNENLKKYFDNLDLIHAFNWEVELTEIFNPSKSEEERGFDVVVGNPPYVRPHKIPLNIKKYFWDFFKVFKEKSDIYNCFIQKGIDLAVEKGLISYNLQKFKRN